MILPDGYVMHPPGPEDDRGSNVARLPPPKTIAPHLFGGPLSVKPDPARDRHQQTERSCAVCGLVKVTVHHPDGRAWREWRLKDCVDQYEDDRTPQCLTAVAAP
jgi:hypothetical protein